MKKLTFAAVSRNYFNLPVWIAQHRGLFAAERLDVAIEISSLIRALPNRVKSAAADYINRTDLHEAQRDVAASWAEA